MASIASSPRCRSVQLRDGDRPIQGDDGRRCDRHQRIVERYDRTPIRLLKARCGRMLRRDRRFDVIAADLGTDGRAFEPLAPGVDHRTIPQRTILIEQRAELAGGIDARRQTRRVEIHQRTQRARRRHIAEAMLREQARQPNRLAAEVHAHDGAGRCAVIAFAEHQIERALHGRQPAFEIGGIGNVEQRAGFGQRFLRAG